VRFVTVLGHRLEYQWVGDPKPSAPTLVFLHEGLGCVAMWRDVPARVASLTGCRALVYSRWGYGGSDPVTLPRPLTYMHDEARALPELLTALDVQTAVLVGHSDGASIALIHASTAAPLGLALLAPHVFCEDVSVQAIERARVAFEEGDLRERLRRYHGANVDGAFRGWNGAWLDPGFRHWDLTAMLPGVKAPVLVIQGADDPYGTLAQVDGIEHGVSGPFERLVLAGCGHDPARDAPEATASAIAKLVARASAASA